MLDYLIAYPWLLATLWALMYIFDYASTIWLSHVYKATLSNYVVFEHGVELNPNFEQEIAARQRLSPRFIIALVLFIVIILVSPWLGFTFVEFLAGALLLTWSFVNSRHLRNYLYVWSLRRRPGSLGGQQLQSYWFMQRMLSAEAFVWGLLYLFEFFLTWRIFFLAGTITCWAFTLRAYRLANRRFPKAA